MLLPGAGDKMIAVTLLAIRWAQRLRRWGGIGLLVLGVVDSSLIPTMGSLDVFTAILAARHKDLWLYYAGMSTAGSLIGALITYRIGYRAGTSWLERKIGEARFDRVRLLLERWGFAAVFVSVLAPPPFPTSPFLLVAGTAGYPLRKFVTGVIAGRAIRYSIIAYIGAHIGRRIIRVLRHPHQYLIPSLAITGALVLIVAALVYLLRRHTHGASGDTSGAAESTD